MKNKILKKSLAMALVLLLLMAGLMGCWNRRELDTLAIVMGLAIDEAPEKNKISITAQLVKPGEVKGPAKGQGSTKAVWVVTSTGYTLFDAVRNFVSQSGRKLFFGHNQVIVIGEEAARKGVKPLLDFVARDHELRRRSWIIVAKGVKGARIMQFQSELEKIPALAISDLLKARAATSTATAVNLNEFLGKLASDGIEPVAGRIELIDGVKPEGEEAGEEDKTKVRLTGTAVFKQDKLAGWLNKPETRGLLWVLEQVKSGIIVVKNPQDEQKPVALEILRADSKVEPEIRSGKLVIKVKIEEEGNLGEAMNSSDITRPEVIRTLEKRQKTVIENEIRAVLRKAQKEFRTDIFGFGAAVFRKYPDEWEKIKDRWAEVYPDLVVELEVEAKLRQHGMVTGSE